MLQGIKATVGTYFAGSIAVAGGVACATVVGPIVLTAATVGLVGSAITGLVVGKKVAA